MYMKAIDTPLISIGSDRIETIRLSGKDKAAYSGIINIPGLLENMSDYGIYKINQLNENPEKDFLKCSIIDSFHNKTVGFINAENVKKCVSSRRRSICLIRDKKGLFLVNTPVGRPPTSSKIIHIFPISERKKKKNDRPEVIPTFVNSSEIDTSSTFFNMLKMSLSPVSAKVLGEYCHSMQTLNAVSKEQIQTTSSNEIFEEINNFMLKLGIWNKSEIDLETLKESLVKTISDNLDFFASEIIKNME